MTTFNVDLTELKTALKLFSFIRPNETVVDYTFLQMTGIVHQPLKLSMTNGAIVAHAQVGAKITEPFQESIILSSLVNMIQHMDGVVTCVIAENWLQVSNANVEHRVPLVVKKDIANHPDTTITGDTVPMPLKPVIDMDYVVITPGMATGFTTDREVVRRVFGKFDTNALLTAQQAKILSDMGNVYMVVYADQVHATDGGNQRILFATPQGITPPKLDNIFAIPPIVEFELNAKEVKEIQSLLHSETLVITVKADELRIIASGENQSIWHKTGVNGDGFLKIKSRVLREMKGGAKVAILKTGTTDALRIENNGVISIAAGNWR